MLNLLKHIFGFVDAHPTEFDGSNEAIEATRQRRWPSENATKGEVSSPAGLAKTVLQAIVLEAEISLPNGGHTYDDDLFQAALERRGYRIIPLSRDVGSHG